MSGIFWDVTCLFYSQFLCACVLHACMECGINIFASAYKYTAVHYTLAHTQTHTLSHIHPQTHTLTYLHVYIHTLIEMLLGFALGLYMLQKELDEFS